MFFFNQIIHATKDCEAIIEAIEKPTIKRNKPLKLNLSINTIRRFQKSCIHITPKPATPARRRLYFLYQVILLHSGAVQLPFHRGLRNNIE